MTTLSNDLPDFHLQGAGEERYDLWEAHIYGGKIAECQATITMPQNR